MSEGKWVGSLLWLYFPANHIAKSALKNSANGEAVGKIFSRLFIAVWMTKLKILTVIPNSKSMHSPYADWSFVKHLVNFASFIPSCSFHLSYIRNISVLLSATAKTWKNCPFIDKTIKFLWISSQLYFIDQKTTHFFLVLVSTSSSITAPKRRMTHQKNLICAHFLNSNSLKNLNYCDE